MTKRNLIIFILCAALSLGCVVNAFATENEAEQTTAATEKAAEVNKDETVYVFANADGSVQKIVVSDWLKNEMQAQSLEDFSELTDIENVKGDAAFDATTWNANGEDVYYQGKIDKELPVTMSITYLLNGKKVKADELAGQSGKVTVHFDYQNCQYQMVKIGEKDEKIYVPFAMLTGLILDSDTFRNVEVKNGKLINDGDHTVVVGMAMPGLQENLGIGKDKINIPDSFEFTADVTDFEMGMSLTIATNSVFNQLDTSKLDSLDGLTDAVKQLSDGMQQLMDGSDELYNGLATLLDKSKELASGVQQLADGSAALGSGAASLNDGAGQLQSGAQALSDGLNQLAANNAALNGGAEQVFNTLLSTAQTQLRSNGLDVPSLSIWNYADVLNGVINSLDATAVYQQALAQVTAAVEQNRPLIVEKVTAAVREQVQLQVTAVVKEQVTEGVKAAVAQQVRAQVIEAATGMSVEEYEAAAQMGLIDEQSQAAIEATIEAQMASENVAALIEANIQSKMESEEIQATITANTDAQMANMGDTIAQNVELQVQQAISEAMASEEVQAKLAAASEGAKAVISLKASLDSYNSFYLGLLTYTEGVATAADGASALKNGTNDLKNGTAQLQSGAATLQNGLQTLNENVPALIDGVEKLKDGAKQLSDGLQKFNKDGIEKIVKLVDGNLDQIVERLKATAEVSKSYRSFSGISNEASGQVKFIYRTAEIR